MSLPNYVDDYDAYLALEMDQPKCQTCNCVRHCEHSCNDCDYCPDCHCKECVEGKGTN